MKCQECSAIDQNSIRLRVRVSIGVRVRVRVRESMRWCLVALDLPSQDGIHVAEDSAGGELERSDHGTAGTKPHPALTAPVGCIAYDGERVQLYQQKVGAVNRKRERGIDGDIAGQATRGSDRGSVRVRLRLRTRVGESRTGEMR